MSLFTEDQLRVRLQRPAADWSADDAASATALDDDITAFIESYTGGVLETIGATYAHDGDINPVKAIYLPHVPKVPATVTAVTVDGDAFTDYKVDRYHALRRNDKGVWKGIVVVTYTYGFDPDAASPPQAFIALRNAALDLAAPRNGNPERVLQARMGSDRSVSFADSNEAAGGLDQGVRAVLDSFKPLAVA